VRLVYEDQGEPFVMHAGDCVLQPPRIRHRVLECSPGLEVVEIGTPAVHATHADHDMPLPTAQVRSNREFGGQRFAWHQSRGGASGGLGLGEASRGVGEARVLREARASAAVHDGELFFGFVLDGAMTVRCEGRTEAVEAGDAFVLPPGRPYDLDGAAPDLAWLQVTLPA
jgi:mannose-6-phosphate isomerase-like protein (cupin superfamily)